MLYTTSGHAQLWINEFHYDNAGTDTDEFVEIAGPIGTSLNGWSIVLYNGSGGASYATIDLTGQALGNAVNGVGFFSTLTGPLYTGSIQNGGPDGIALVGPGGVEQFLSYEGSFLATNGPANGQASTNIGFAFSESSSTPVGHSLQLQGSGSQYSDFTWTTPDANTSGSINNSQTITAPCTDPSPTITNFTPVAGAVGSIVTVEGTDLALVDDVIFDGITINTADWTYDAVNDHLTFTVPAGTESSTIQLVNGCASGTSVFDFKVDDTNCFGPPPDALIISEICDPGFNPGTLNNPDAYFRHTRFIEIYNPTPNPVDLTGWTLRAIGNGGPLASTPPDVYVFTLSGTINPGQALTMGDDQGDEITWTPAPATPVPSFDFMQADWNTDIVNNNYNGQWRDGAALYNGSTLVDVILRQDGSSNQSGYFENGRIVRNDDVCVPNATTTASSGGDIFEWTSSSVNEITDATPGTHTVTCTPPPAVGPPPTLTTDPVTQSICEGETVTFTTDNLGGGVTYQWFRASFRDGFLVSYTGMSNFGNLSGANSHELTVANATAAVDDSTQYFCVVDDGSGSCSVATAAAQLFVNPSPTLTLSPTDPSGCGASDGQIVAEVTPSTASDYTFTMSPDPNSDSPIGPQAGTTATFDNLPGNSYTVTVTDDNSCAATATETLNAPASPALPTVASARCLFAKVCPRPWPSRVRCRRVAHSSGTTTPR